eukprot:4608059-Amphidinium_carterae.1
MACHRDMLWPRNQWVREIMFALAAHGWVTPVVVPHIRDELVKWSRQWFSSVIVENTLRLARKNTASPAGGHGILKMYHHLLSDADLSADYGRKSVPVGP